MKKINFKSVNTAQGHMGYHKDITVFVGKKGKSNFENTVKNYADTTTKEKEDLFIVKNVPSYFDEYVSQANSIISEPIIPKPVVFEIGDVVKLVKNSSHSTNLIGEEGIITIIGDDDESYKVEVQGREYSSGNWSFRSDLELVTRIEVDPPTDEEVFNSIDVVFNDRTGFEIRCLNKRKLLIPFKPQGLRFNTTNISCGINQFEGINHLFNYTVFKEFFERLGYDQLVNRELHLTLLKKGFKLIFERKRIGFLLMSTNIDNNSEIEEISKILDSFKNVSWTDTYNQNSRNNIRLWVCDLHKYQND